MDYDDEPHGLMRAESEVVAPSAMLAHLPAPRSSSEIIAPSAMFIDLMMLEPLPKLDRDRKQEAPAKMPAGYVPTPAPAPREAPAPPPAVAPPAPAQAQPQMMRPMQPTTMAAPMQPMVGHPAPRAFAPTVAGQPGATGQHSAAAAAMAAAAQAAGAKLFQHQAQMQMHQPRPVSVQMPGAMAPRSFMGQPQQVSYSTAGHGYSQSYSMPSAQPMPTHGQPYQSMQTTYATAFNNVSASVAAPATSVRCILQAVPTSTGAPHRASLTAPVTTAAPAPAACGAIAWPAYHASAAPGQVAGQHHYYMQQQHQGTTMQATMLAQTIKMQGSAGASGHSAAYPSGSIAGATTRTLPQQVSYPLATTYGQPGTTTSYITQGAHAPVRAATLPTQYMSAAHPIGTGMGSPMPAGATQVRTVTASSYPGMYGQQIYGQPQMIQARPMAAPMGSPPQARPMAAPMGTPPQTYVR
mmetsp:Transcript_33315/g.86419  ORF Transcript_33315/g.86419 Transcript_33315/m.86419 type:complete len:466 (-) Transcript_33315:70-1467(-)